MESGLLFPELIKNYQLNYILKEITLFFLLMSDVVPILPSEQKKTLVGALEWRWTEVYIIETSSMTHHLFWYRGSKSKSFIFIF